ncbi:hypothetical protein FKM82_025054 [Ascaphus truei]
MLVETQSVAFYFFYWLYMSCGDKTVCQSSKCRGTPFLPRCRSIKRMCLFCDTGRAADGPRTEGLTRARRKGAQSQTSGVSRLGPAPPPAPWPRSSTRAGHGFLCSSSPSTILYVGLIL